mgnify:CR=1 FL=1
MKNTTPPIPVTSAIPQQQNNMLPNNPVAQQNPLQQVAGAVGDMVRNYIDMKRDNTIKGDDYFHCKANYEAAQRGKIGENIAEKLGNAKEEFDFWIINSEKDYHLRKLFLIEFMIEQSIRLVDKWQKVDYIKIQEKLVIHIE